MVIFMTVCLSADYDVTRVDFLSRYGLQVNGAGPLLVRTDPQRNRMIVVHTYTSSISVIAGRNHSVLNIPIASRIPQYVKDEALQIDSTSGHIYLIGNRCLHIIFPEKKKSITIPTIDQFEMVAINETNGNACLVGRSSKNLALVSPRQKKNQAEALAGLPGIHDKPESDTSASHSQGSVGSAIQPPGSGRRIQCPALCVFPPLAGF